MPFKNPEDLKTWRIKYNEDNKDKIKQYKYKKIECVCGGKYDMNHRARHMKSKKHQKYEYMLFQ